MATKEDTLRLSRHILQRISLRVKSLLRFNHGVSKSKEITLCLPNDILRIILSSLPVKSLLRFKTVSKSWNTMMSDPVFIQLNLQKSKDSNSANLFLGNYFPDNSQVFSLIKLEGRKFQIEALPECPCNFDAVLCYCDGVFLLGDNSCTLYVLWNPCNRRKTLFWFPYKVDNSHMHYGLCHDPAIGEFKIVIISGMYYAVFSCKNKSWSSRKAFPYHTGKGPNSTGLPGNGAIYWIWWDKNEPHDQKIIYFDSRDDKFKVLQKPEDVQGSDELCLVCLNGCLWLYRRSTRNNTTVKIWIKDKDQDENSWIEFLEIENVEMTRELPVPLCFVENKVVITLSGDAKSGVYYFCENINQRFQQRQLLHLRLFPCVDSLFFPVEDTEKGSA